MTSPLPPAIPPVPYRPYAYQDVPQGPKPSDAQRLVTFLLDHNPFYLLSALSMLFGCYLLNSAFDVRTGEIGKILWLLATTNLYEIVLIALGLFLFVRRGLRRDARLLLILQALFMADATFLVSEVASTRALDGAVLSSVLLLLALAKVWVVFRVLRLECSFRTFGIITLQLVLLFTLPILLRHLSSDGTLPAIPFYGLWWLMFLIPLAHDLLTRILPPAEQIRAAERAPELRIAYAVVPYLLLAAHLGFLHWIFRADYVIADLTPVLLGLAVATLRIRPSDIVSLPQLRIAQVALPVIAFFISLGASYDLMIPVQTLAFTITPGMVAFVATPLVITYCIAFRWLGYVAAAQGLLAAVYVFGPSLDTVGRMTSKTLQLIRDVFNMLIPRTNTAWGVVAVLGSFALLAMGAVISMLRGPVHHDAE